MGGGRGEDTVCQTAKQIGRARREDRDGGTRRDGDRQRAQDESKIGHDNMTGDRDREMS